MTNEVIWTKLVLERFIQLANLTEEEEIVIRTRAAGWSRVKQAMELNISICCCTTQRAIDGVNYNGAINTAAINANTTEQTQKVLDAIAQNKIEALQAQVNQLQLQAAMCGVVRYPNATTYCSGSNPFGGCGCGAAI